MNRIVLSLLALCLFPLVKCTGQSYAIELIPDSLLKNSVAVKRMEEIQVIIYSTKRIVVKHKYAITILNEEGDKYAGYVNSYSSLKNLMHIDGNLYDANGKKIASVKKKDIEDVAYSDGFSLMRDDRLKSHRFHSRQYPYTVEYEDEEENKESYFLPFWMPVDGNYMSVQSSKFSVETPLDFTIRIKQFNHKDNPTLSKDVNQTYTWQLNNFKPINAEAFQPSIKELVPMVYIGPETFSIGGYEGDMKTWQTLGLFHRLLNAGRDEVPIAIKEEILSLTKGISYEKEKIKIIYQYLQKNTRYISVQLGIGGWQSFDARYVAENKYGDCKALSNYMISLLKEVGIKAYYVLITAGRGRKGLTPDFPAPYFNHVICCVPGQNDTTWLECTSQIEAPGFLGSFTGNRKALLIGDDGGYVVNTPSYSANDNRQIRKVEAKIDATGNMVADVKTLYSGIQQEIPRSLFYSASKEEKEEYLQQILSIPSYNLMYLNYREINAEIPRIEEKLQIKADGFATISGKRIFIVPNFMNQSTTKLTEYDRQFPIQLDMSFLEIDSMQIEIPEGYIVESAPKNVSLMSPFGEYNLQFTYQNNTLLLIRRLTREMNTFPASDYLKLVEFMNTIYKADHSKIVMVKKENS